MKQSQIIALATLGLLLLFAWWISTHEKVTRQEYIGYQGEARINPFLAAEMLLKELGIEADSRATMTPGAWLPDTGDTLVRQLSLDIVVPQERDVLINWVTEGGHLVLLPPGELSPVMNSFLDYLGIGFTDVQIPEDFDPDEDYLLAGEFRIVPVEDGTIDASLSDDGGIIAARSAWGSGYITMLASSDFMQNTMIDEPGSAKLLLDVVAGYVEPGKVWLVYDTYFPSLWSLLWAHGRAVIMSLAAALLLWLWAVMPRFGPPISPLPLTRRSLIEHILATGNFVWRRRGGARLARQSATAVMREAERRHPGISRLPASRQVVLVARITGLPASMIRDILQQPLDLRPREFSHQMQALQKIRKEL